jgi:hypothetical protein
MTGPAHLATILDHPGGVVTGLLFAVAAVLIGIVVIVGKRRT